MFTVSTGNTIGQYPFQRIISWIEKVVRIRAVSERYICYYFFFPNSMGEKGYKEIVTNLVSNYKQLASKDGPYSQNPGNQFEYYN